MKELGERAGCNKIAGLMRLAELASQTGYRMRRYYGGRKPLVANPNYLERQFVVTTPNINWVSDKTYKGRMTVGCIWPLFLISSRAGLSAHGRRNNSLVNDRCIFDDGMAT